MKKTEQLEICRKRSCEEADKGNFLAAEIYAREAEKEVERLWPSLTLDEQSQMASEGLQRIIDACRLKADVQ